jgi:hypothetical protein
MRAIEVNDVKGTTQENQYEVEAALIESNPRTCVTKVRKSGGTNTLDKEKVMKLYEGARYFFYAYEFMEYISCLFDGSFYDMGKYSLSDSVRNSFLELKKIGEASIDGNAWLANFRDIDDLIIIKTPKSVIDDALIYHEYFVAMTSLNKLRKSALIFEYVYGIFQCDPPENKFKTDKFCLGEDNPVNYLMVENIINSTTLYDFIEFTIIDEIIPLIMMLILGLDLALWQSDFTHWDLHTRNVLVKDVSDNGDNGDNDDDKPIYIKLRADQKFYMQSNYIPVVIDYGRSHINYNDRDFGYHLIPDHIKDESSPETDLYRLLCQILYGSLRSQNLDLFSELYTVLEFFPHYVHARNRARIRTKDFDEIIFAQDFIDGEGYFEIRDRYRDNTPDYDKSKFYSRFFTFFWHLPAIKPYLNLIITEPPVDAKIIEPQTSL